METVSDNYLITQLREDDRVAFTLIYDKYHAGIYGFALKYVREVSLAQDIVQHTFLKLWEVRRKLNPYLSLQGYLYKIAKNHTLNILRNYNSAALKNMEYYRESAESHYSEDSETERPNMISVLRRSIDKLSPQRAAICRMKIEEGMSNQEIAEKLNISQSTVKNQYNTSIKLLKELMGAGLAVIALLGIFTII